MAIANAGTSYGAADEELAALFDEKFRKFPDVNADYTFLCTATMWCTHDCTDSCF